ncbi:MAG: acetoacetate--CoA ligase [Acidimicrobiales bacterium]
MTEPIWKPSDDRVATTRLSAFITHVNERASLGAPLSSYEDLHRWSVDEPAAFWEAVWDFMEVRGSRGERIVEWADHISNTRFFPDATLNFAENLLRRNDDSTALLFRGEAGHSRDVSWAELNTMVAEIAAAMRAAGVTKTDRVAVWLPNLAETYAIMLAAASIGASFTSTSPDFGSAGVVDRFSQTEPVILFATDGYFYGGRQHDTLTRLDDIVAQLPSLRTVVVVPYASEQPEVSEPATLLNDWVAPHRGAELVFEQLPFDHPLYVLYSSGTTGKPKCIVHRAGGVLLKHLVEHVLQTDVRPGDRVFYFTTAGWMMWNWLASGLAAEATLVLYDGNPAWPDHNRLFDLADEVEMTMFGTSASFLDSLNKVGLRPVDTHNLSTVRTMCSTGSPLTPEGYAYVYDAFKTDLHLSSMSGGTDLCGCLVAGNPNGAVFAGEIQVAGLGMDIAVVDDDGVDTGTGQGELVCRAPFPSMPLGFWNDPDDQRYQAAYYEQFDNVWHQGDFASWTPNGGMVIHGRSDATLNPGGVRIGTAEIYRQVEKVDAVLESLVIGQQWPPDTRVVLFVVLRDEVALDDQLESLIRSEIRTGASPRHVPARIVAVPELPRTRSGKLVELAVRKIVHGQAVKNIEALANPEALEHFRNLEALNH